MSKSGLKRCRVELYKGKGVKCEIGFKNQLIITNAL